MVPLKEDGSLDIEYINSLPLDEYMNVMGELTRDQVEEYISKLPPDTSREPVRAIEVDYELDDELKRGSVLADELIDRLRKKYLK